VILDDAEALVSRARRLTTLGRRAVLGIAGPPGSGKSTIAETIVAALGEAAVLVPMDGFHLAQDELVRLGRRDRMGAHDTFDAAGYRALLRRLRDGADDADDVVYAPAFRREIEEPIAGAIAVERSVPLVVTEGNYLLLDAGEWAGVRALLDEAWYVAVEDETRLARLIDRHIRFGKTPEAAEEWVLRSDEVNAALVAATQDRADVVVRLRRLTRRA
jgi:pantothenate kinase